MPQPYLIVRFSSERVPSSGRFGSFWLRVGAVRCSARGRDRHHPRRWRPHESSVHRRHKQQPYPTVHRHRLPLSRNRAAPGGGEGQFREPAGSHNHSRPRGGCRRYRQRPDSGARPGWNVHSRLRQHGEWERAIQPCRSQLRPIRMAISLSSDPEEQPRPTVHLPTVSLWPAFGRRGQQPRSVQWADRQSPSTRQIYPRR